MDTSDTTLSMPPEDSQDLQAAQSVALGKPHRAIPETIGNYRILRLLGQGGMGAVYEAEQDHPRRKVALKVIKTAAASPALLRRFELESQALARLHHPGIAQVYEAGSADTGDGLEPYFAMEYVADAERLTSYVERHKLSVRRRLELMVQICDAVEHAHRRGIIHRDLKPGNILVDPEGRIKILDFGVARITDSDAQATRQTDMGQLVGTLAYMSPEQALADPLELDTRSDVYTLGLILYELLAGRLPYALKSTLFESLEIIRQAEPAPLTSVDSAYRGDLQVIVAKTLEKDKTQRYSSAADLGADIQRYLKDEPILARSPSVGYQLRKFARRNRALVFGIAAVFAVLVAGIAVSTWQAVRARRAEQTALQERDTAKAVTDFLEKDLLNQADPGFQVQDGAAKADPRLDVRTALDRAASRIEGKFAAQPLVEASIRKTVGGVYIDLGAFPEAMLQFQRALQVRQRLLGETHPETLASMDDVAAVLERQGKFAEAEDVFAKVLAIRRKTMGEQAPETLTSMFNVAGTMSDRGELAEADALYSEILPMSIRAYGQEDFKVLAVMINLSEIFMEERKYEQAQSLYEKTLDILKRKLGDQLYGTITLRAGLAHVYGIQGKYDRARQMLVPALDEERRILGDRHLSTLETMNDLARLYMQEGKSSAAEALYREGLQAAQETLGDGHSLTLEFLSGLADISLLDRQPAEAEAAYRKVLAGRLKALGPDHPNTVAALGSVGRAQLEQRKYVQAETTLREAASRYEKARPDYWERYYTENLLGAALAGQKKFEEAEPLLVSGYDRMVQREETMPVSDRKKLAEAQDWILKLYADWQKPEKASEWRSKRAGTTTTPNPR
jgi:tetratricopeptide (TPR) repeat protein